ncbi:hypothetical protein F5Y11DRAFT_51757 [Daldinia sp. FL1419]|nr:hypothetical protein F5Y11DRAFT_51757 [Daldinia sp. FL1419]
MSPAPNTSYKSQSQGWIWYSSHETRPDNCPPFDMKDETMVVIPNGELFCRFNMNHSTDKPVELCFRTDKQSHWANLKRHVESHRIQMGDEDVPVTLEKNRTGGLTMTDHRRLVNYWDTVQQHIESCDAGEEPRPVDKTPTRPDNRPSNAPKAKDLFTLPMTKARKGAPSHPFIMAMKMMVGQKSKACRGCQNNGKSACPPNRKHYCQLWLRFKVHTKESPEEVSEDEDDESGTENSLHTLLDTHRPTSKEHLPGQDNSAGLINVPHPEPRVFRSSKTSEQLPDREQHKLNTLVDYFAGQ